MSAAGILHLLLSDNADMNFRYTLIVVASFGAALWIGSEWLLRAEHMKAAAKRDNESQLPPQKLAREEPFSLNGKQFAAGGRRI
jgi:hypothetical protein